jgi:GAF domain-containing protein
MSQVSTKRTPPRGWDRMVAQLQASPDLVTFHKGLLDLQCKIVAAEYGALWLNDTSGKPRAMEVWPQRLSDMPADNPIMNVLSEAAQSGFQRSVSHVLKAEPEGQPANADSAAHVFVTAMRVKGEVVAISTVVAECRDAQVLQSTAPLRELAAGLYDGYIGRLEARRYEADAARIREAIALLGVTQEADGFEGACLNLVNELARSLKCARVSLGWTRGKMVRLTAMSDTEHVKRHSEHAAGIEMAMAECFDQEQPVLYPVPDDAEPLLQQTVVHNHRRLVGGTPGRVALSLPLRVGDEIVGVLLFERGDGTFPPDDIQFLQLVVDVISPHLHDRKYGARNIAVHAYHDVETAASYLVGPRHTIWKAGAVALSALLLFVLFGTWNYRITAPFVFEASERRIVPAPFEGQLVDVFVKPGVLVKAGDKLAQFEVEPLQLQRDEAFYRYQSANLERNAYMNENEISKSQQAQAMMDQLDARVKLLDYLITHATVTSPVDGYVLDGAWHDRIGGVISQGEAMFEVAPLDKLVAVVRVDESDIDQVDDGTRGESMELFGEIATRSEPQIGFNIAVERIVPLARPVNGSNAFEVRSTLTSDPWSAAKSYAVGDTAVYNNIRYRVIRAVDADTTASPDSDLKHWESAEWLRPGMEGIAKLEVGSKPVYWILTHRIADKLRLWLWL